MNPFRLRMKQNPRCITKKMRRYLSKSTFSPPRRAASRANDDDDDGDDIPCARTDDGPAFGDVRNATTCYGCGGTVSWRRAHKRKRNGIAHEVSGHFFHLGERPATCTNETIRHKAAKHAVKTLRVFRYDAKCVTCDGTISVDTAEEGWTTRDEHSWGSYRLDVAFVAADGRVGGAVEIYETHKIPDEKAETLTRDDIAWVEVTAEEILRRVRLGEDFASSRVPVLRCAAVECRECENARAEQKRRRAKEQRKRRKPRERYARNSAFGDETIRRGARGGDLEKHRNRGEKGRVRPRRREGDEDGDGREKNRRRRRFTSRKTRKPHG